MASRKQWVVPAGTGNLQLARNPLLEVISSNLLLLSLIAFFRFTVSEALMLVLFEAYVIYLLGVAINFRRYLSKPGLPLLLAGVAIMSLMTLGGSFALQRIESPFGEIEQFSEVSFSAIAPALAATVAFQLALYLKGDRSFYTDDERMEEKISNSYGVVWVVMIFGAIAVIFIDAAYFIITLLAEALTGLKAPDVLFLLNGLVLVVFKAFLEYQVASNFPHLPFLRYPEKAAQKQKMKA